MGRGASPLLFCGERSRDSSLTCLAGDPETLSSGGSSWQILFKDVFRSGLFGVAVPIQGVFNPKACTWIQDKTSGPRSPRRRGVVSPRLAFIPDLEPFISHDNIINSETNTIHNMLLMFHGRPNWTHRFKPKINDLDRVGSGLQLQVGLQFSH